MQLIVSYAKPVQPHRRLRFNSEQSITMISCRARPTLRDTRFTSKFPSHHHHSKWEIPHLQQPKIVEKVHIGTVRQLLITTQNNAKSNVTNNCQNISASDMPVTSHESGTCLTCDNTQCQILHIVTFHQLHSNSESQTYEQLSKHTCVQSGKNPWQRKEIKILRQLLDLHELADDILL